VKFLKRISKKKKKIISVGCGMAKLALPVRFMMDIASRTLARASLEEILLCSQLLPSFIFSDKNPRAFRRNMGVNWMIKLTNAIRHLACEYRQWLNFRTETTRETGMIRNAVFADPLGRGYADDATTIGGQGSGVRQSTTASLCLSAKIWMRAEKY